MRRKVTLTSAPTTTPKIVGPWTLFGMKILRKDKQGNITHASHGAWTYPADKFPSFKDAVADFTAKQGQHGWGVAEVATAKGIVIWKPRN